MYYFLYCASLLALCHFEVVVLHIVLCIVEKANRGLEFLLLSSLHMKVNFLLLLISLLMLVQFPVIKKME